jgi:peroxiredoxin
MLSQLQDNIDEFRRLGAQVFGISVDTHYTQEVFATERGISYGMLSDFNREAMTVYGIRIEDLGGYHGVARRSIWVVDQNQKVVHADVPTERGVRPDVEAALNAVRQLDQGKGTS